jgi:hypothetical protein
MGYTEATNGKYRRMWKTRPTAAAWVQARVKSCGMFGTKSGTGAGSLRVLRIPLPIIPPTAQHSSSSSFGAGKVGQTGRRTKRTVSPYTKKITIR